MDKETKRVVKAACCRGWVLVTGKKHPALVHTASGLSVTLSASPSTPNAALYARKWVEKIEKEYAAGKDFCSPDQCLCRVLGDDPGKCDMGVARVVA